MYHISKLIPQYLYLNMSGIFNQLLHINRIITEARHGFPLCGFIGILHFLTAPHNTDTFSTTSGRGLDHNRISETIRHLIGLIKTLDNSIAAGIGQGTAYVDDKVAAQAEFIFMIG